jgi:hypothetical protein
MDKNKTMDNTLSSYDAWRATGEGIVLFLCGGYTHETLSMRSHSGTYCLYRRAWLPSVASSEAVPFGEYVTWAEALADGEAAGFTFDMPTLSAVKRVRDSAPCYSCERPNLYLYPHGGFSDDDGERVHLCLGCSPEGERQARGLRGKTWTRKS